MHYAEERYMTGTPYFRFSLYAFAIGLILSGSTPLALASKSSSESASAESSAGDRHQEKQWDADIFEAKARARDFEKHLARENDQARVRELAAEEIKREREKDEREQERAREAFIRYRDSHPSTEAAQIALEKAHEKELEREQEAYDRLQAEFVRGRNRFERTLAREANIDEAREYNVYSSPTIEWQKKNEPPHLLKLNIEPSKNK